MTISDQDKKELNRLYKKLKKQREKAYKVMDKIDNIHEKYYLKDSYTKSDIEKSLKNIEELQYLAKEYSIELSRRKRAYKELLIKGE